jgi:hypothetical protein
MRDLRERAAFPKEALEAQPVQRLLLGLDARRQLAGRTPASEEEQVFLERDQVVVGSSAR